MFANSVAPPLAVDTPSGSRCPRVAAARRLLISLLTTDRIRCAEAANALGAEWVRQQGLAPFVWQVCHTTPNLSPAAATQLQTSYYSAAGDAELQRTELHTVLSAFVAEGITPIVFKGAALGRTVYPDPVCRPMGDLDLWIEPAELPRAQAALRRLGYAQITNLDRPPALMTQFGGEIHMSGLAADAGLIELHLSVFLGEWLRQAARVDEDSVRARVRSQELEGVPVYLMSPEDALIQLATHLVINHQVSFFAARNLLDMALLARRQSMDWPVVVQRTQAWRLDAVVWLALSLAIDLAGLEEAAEAVRQLQPSTLRRRLIHRFANAETLVEMHDLSSSKWRYVFLLLLVDRLRDGVKLVFRALWPERAWLIARYGRYTFSTRVRHLFDAARGKI
jgi:hypothetical protein